MQVVPKKISLWRSMHLIVPHICRREPEFYSNLRQHTDLCTEVAKNARASLLLTALNSVASQTHACGTVSCLDLIFSIFSKLGWHMGLLVIALMVVAPNFLYMMFKLQFQQHQQQQNQLRQRPVAHAYAMLSSSLEEQERQQQQQMLHVLNLKKRRSAHNNSCSSSSGGSSSSCSVIKLV